MSERAHPLPVVSLVVSAWRALRSRRIEPVALAIVGSGLLIAGHLVEWRVVEWAGVVLLFIGGIRENRRK